MKTPCRVAWLRLIIASVVASAAGSSWASVDPWEGMNRGIHRFNDFGDRYLIKPIARTYDRVLPEFLKRGIHNVFRNAGTPSVVINQLLQGKPRAAFSDLGRFAMNTSVGIGGVFDVATRAGMDVHDEDFGQTLRVWGFQNGPYLVIPFRGPATVTHAGGMVVESFLNPIRFISPARDRYAVTALRLVDIRRELLTAEPLISGDEYLFLRDAYFQRREFLIKDGALGDDPFFDELDDLEDLEP